MPRMPDIDDLGKVNFITNYFLAGCSPPFMLFCEFAKEPGADLLLLFLIPDFQDIGQAIFDPKGGRRRKPGRHGRKSGRGGGFPDPSDAVGQQVRGVVNPHNALNFGPFNKAFRLLNAYEGVAITAAVLEGITDVGYEGLLGVLTVDPNHCTEFPRIVKSAEWPQLTGGPGEFPWPFRIDVLEANVGFNQTDFGVSCPFSDYRVHIRVVVHNGSDTEAITCSIQLIANNSEVRATSRIVTIDPNQTVTLQCDGKFEKLEWCNWGVGDRFGFPLLLTREIVGFAQSGVPWPF